MYPVTGKGETQTHMWIVSISHVTPAAAVIYWVRSRSTVELWKALCLRRRYAS